MDRGSSCAIVVFAFASLAGTAASQTVRVSNALMGGTANGPSGVPSLSGNGRFVTFESRATNVVDGDTNGVSDVFAHDLETGETVLVSVGTNNVRGDGDSTGSVIAADGRFVAFVSMARSLVSPPLVFSTAQVYVRDLVAGSTEVVSVSPAGAPADGNCRAVSLSANGRWIAFESDAQNLVTGDFNGRSDIFVRDRAAGTTERESVNSSGVAADGRLPAISGDGRFVVFITAAPNIVPEGTGNNPQVVVRDRQSGSVVLASGDAMNHPRIVTLKQPSLSTDGRLVAFQSNDGALAIDDTNSSEDAFVRDLASGHTIRVSLSSGGNQLARGGTSPRITASGRFVVFVSSSPDAVPGATGREADVYVRDLQTASTTWRSPNWLGVRVVADCLDPWIGDDGTRVAFDTLGALTPDDGNGAIDVFVHAPEPFACAAGNGGIGSGALTGLLRVNGSTGGDSRVITAAVGQPIDVRLDAPRLGPAAARYVLWVWPGAPTRSFLLQVSGVTLGCTVDPTPFQPFGLPQPIRCVRGGLSPLVCIGVTELHGPARAPFNLNRANGFATPATFTVQGMVQDSGTIAPLPYSVTNAVVLRIQ